MGAALNMTAAAAASAAAAAPVQPGSDTPAAAQPGDQAAAGPVPAVTASAAAASSSTGVCGAAILDVPFLDPLTAMIDEELALTVAERSEWGDPLHNEVGWWRPGQL